MNEEGVYEEENKEDNDWQEAEREQGMDEDPMKSLEDDEGETDKRPWSNVVKKKS